MDQLPKLNVIIEPLHSAAQLPQKANPTDACYDLAAAEENLIEDGKTGMVSLGWAMQLEEGWEARIRGRSGLASRGIVAHYGTIDHTYRKEVKVLIHNLSGEDFDIKVGDRIAQLSFAPVFPVHLEEGMIEMTQRGGFGSTGTS